METNRPTSVPQYISEVMPNSMSKYSHDLERLAEASRINAQTNLALLRGKSSGDIGSFYQTIQSLGTRNKAEEVAKEAFMDELDKHIVRR